MPRDPRHDILFEPVRIGPVTARNRFYQVPHCNGMGRMYPSSMAEMRRVKAEGGWAVICTEEVEIHPSADHTPWCGGRLWNDDDVPILARMCDGIHEFGSLAGIELNHAGQMSANRYSRLPPLAPSHMPVAGLDPVQARAMDKHDIRELRRWHKEAALRARTAGFDIVYVYAGHQLSTISHFLSRERNHRDDEYGGSLENRARLLREILEDTRDAVGDTCAIALRLAVDELRGKAGISSDGEGRDLVEMLAELPDLWDVNISAWENDSAPSRFKGEGFQEDFISFVKTVTSKPVVGVGRYTSPDRMVSLIRGGVLDFIGAARPSIADPFLPQKIEQGRPEDIRECIGCNICVSGDQSLAPMRCTQNPTMGEEWRRGWHPERIAPRHAAQSVLIVGGGPAGLEAARALGQRGYDVSLADAGQELGGRLVAERRLPGLAEWGRVVDYRVWQISQMPNVKTYPASTMSAGDIRDFGADHVVLATGARWCLEGRGRSSPLGLPRAPGAVLIAPEAIMAGEVPGGPVVILDDDHYVLGALLAEKLCAAGAEVIYVTPESRVSAWTWHTLEQQTVQRRLIEMGVRIETDTLVAGIAPGRATLECIFTGRQRELDCAALVPLTRRLPVEGLWHDLNGALPELTRIGDCLAPGTIAAAVYSGHGLARGLGAPVPAHSVTFRRELVALSEVFPPESESVVAP